MGICIINGTKSLTPPEVVSNETLSRHNLYGVVFNGVSSAGKPLYNAIDQKWTPATPTDPGVDTWKDLAPFNVKKCITDYDTSETHKRRVLAYEGGGAEYDSLKAAKTGDRMVEFPLGYYYRPDPWTFIVSPDPIEGFQPSPACDLGNGTILNGFRLSEFDLCYVSSVPRSIPGYAPSTSTGADTFRNNLKAKGWYLETFGAWCWINFLRVIKQKNLSSRKINGAGITDGKGTVVMTEDSIQGLDGYIDPSGINHVRTLGLQNFYGNVWGFLHNAIVISGNRVWVKKDFTNADTIPAYANLISNGWKELDVSIPAVGRTAHYCKEIAYNHSDTWALYPSIDGGNNIEPVGDVFCSESSSPYADVIIGGSYADGGLAGSFSWWSCMILSTTHPNVGARSLEVF